ncbi:hypothetical protein Pelo_6318 [Pelomyxa schiedti]|nr:hypothetical protein Pelo_6318 [Pelomyxa schiedti]
MTTSSASPTLSPSTASPSSLNGAGGNSNSSGSGNGNGNGNGSANANTSASNGSGNAGGFGSGLDDIHFMLQSAACTISCAVGSVITNGSVTAASATVSANPQSTGTSFGSLSLSGQQKAFTPDPEYCCEVQTSGPISLNIYLSQNSTTRPLKCDLRMTTMEVLQMALRELGKKLVEQDCNIFRLFLKPVGHQGTLSDPYWLPEDAPLWMFRFGPQDLVEVKKKPHDNSMDDSIILKVFIPEQRACSTLKLSPTFTVASVAQTVNEFPWKSIDVQYFPITTKHLQYYGLYHKTSQGWVLLEEDVTLAAAKLSSPSIVSLKRKKVLGLKYDHATGPIEATVMSRVLGKNKNQLKLSVSLDQSSGELMCSLIKFSDTMCPNLNWTMAQEETKKTTTKPGITVKGLRKLPSIQGLHKPSAEPSVGNPPTRQAPSPSSVELDYEDAIMAAIDSPSQEFQLCLCGKVLDVTDDMAAQSYNRGDVFSLRMGKNALHFRINYFPAMELSQNQTAIQTGIELEGEFIVLESVKDVRHIFVSPPATQISTPVIVMGYIYISNYQLVFRSYKNTQKDELKIPLASITRVDKFGGKTGALDKYYIDITCKDSKSCVRFGFPKKGTARRSVVTTLNEYAFNKPLFAFSHCTSPDKIGWSIYDPEKEYQRMGVPGQSGWKLTQLNQDFHLCNTYPKLLAVPEEASEEIIRETAAFRSRGRLPVLSWRNATGVCICRSSQPCVGLKGNRSMQDEEYVRLMMKTNTKNPNFLYILDSRPRANAIGNRAIGGGYEDTGPMSGYPHCKLEFEEIVNIHAVRESYQKLRDLCSPATVEDGLWYPMLEQTHWMDIMKTILSSVAKTVHTIEKLQLSVLLHCSDG